MTQVANSLFLQSRDGISDGLAWALILESGVNASKQHQSQNLQLPPGKPWTQGNFPLDDNHCSHLQPYLQSHGQPWPLQHREGAAALQHHGTPSSLSNFFQGKDGKSTTVGWRTNSS